MESTTQDPTDRDLLERVERAAAARAAEEQVAAEAERAAARARAEAAERERRQQAAQVIEPALVEARQAVATLVECAETWHRNVEKLRTARDLISRTLAPFATTNKHEAAVRLAELAADHELKALLEDPARKRTAMETSVMVVAERRAARCADIAREVLAVPATDNEGVAS